MLGLYFDVKYKCNSLLFEIRNLRFKILTLLNDACSFCTYLGAFYENTDQ